MPVLEHTLANTGFILFISLPWRSNAFFCLRSTYGAEKTLNASELSVFVQLLNSMLLVTFFAVERCEEKIPSRTFPTASPDLAKASGSVEPRNA